MSVDPKVLRRVTAKFEEKRRIAEEELSRRRAEIYGKSPEIREIETEMRSALSEVARAAFSSDSDPASMIGAIHARNIELIRRRGELLVEMGYPVDYLTYSPECKKCGDMGYIGARPCECFEAACASEQARELSSILNTGVQNFDTFRIEYYSDRIGDGRSGISPRDNMERICDECKEFCASFGRHSVNLFFTGGAGLGKTFLSSCIAKAVADEGFSVVYDTAISIVSCFERDKFGANLYQDETAAQIRRYFMCDLLIIDDLGTEMATAFSISAIYNLLNTRLIKGKSIIISTNLTIDDIEKRYSPQIASRIDGEFHVLPFFGEDIRKLRREEREARGY